MAKPLLLPEQTIPYKTWVKTSIVEALREVFSNHPDTKIRSTTKISIDFPTSELKYPAVVVRFRERTVRNAGVGHVEFLYSVAGEYVIVAKDASGLVVHVESVNDDGLVTIKNEWEAAGYSVKIFDQYTSLHKYRHYLYDGSIEFAIYALSSLDRDLISDTLVQTLSMPDMAGYTNNFFNRIYFPTPETPTDSGDYERGEWNYVNLNTDMIRGGGETHTPQPWLSEDQLVYQSSYSVDIYGEFYSLPPINTQPAYGLISDVKVYPYAPSVGEGVPVSIDGADDVIDPPWSDLNPDEQSVLAYDPTQWH